MRLKRVLVVVEGALDYGPWANNTARMKPVEQDRNQGHEGGVESIYVDLVGLQRALFSENILGNAERRSNQDKQARHI